ncbi:hypothetical protein BA895_13055 [Humibacillus sp. DSM 29435]|uniref:ABC transporter permease n=1 Tax=Humibacillus sp. DSM 29435 TaxID=1869167 RepID=UPI0008732DB6|nr:ABC transporter permease subunit [Humibacillus sp. DSM 29435]OFE18058.1 hypothetical protein BA895_13055 [Humibacillus sp. DSM 29435]
MRGRTSTRPSHRGARSALPAVLLVVVVVVTALVALVLTATGLMPLVGRPHLRSDAFAAVAPDLLVQARESLLVGVAATVVAVAVGFAVALLLLTTRSGSRALSVVVTVPIPVAHLVGAASFALLLTGSGLANRLFGSPPDQWPSLVGGPWPVAAVLAFAWKESAFVALVVTATLAENLTDYSEAAALLGASRFARVRHVVLPLSAPALIGAGTIVLLYTLGNYEVMWLLGRAYPETLPVAANRLFGSIDLTSRPGAAVTALATTGLALAAAAAAVPLVRRAGMAR